MVLLKCQSCDRLRIHGEWLLPEEIEGLPEGKTQSSYCRYCVMEMSLTRHKDLVENLKLRLIDIAEPLIEIGGEASIRKAAQHMTELNQGILGVIRDDALVGILTERDITRRVIAQKLDPATVRVASMMSAPVKMVPATASLPEATLKMSLEKIRHLVIQRPERPHRIVSARILAETMVQALSQAYTVGKKEGSKKKKRS